MTAISADTIVQRRDDLLANDLSPTETVMLDVAGGSYYGLRDVSKVIWDYLESPLTVQQLCDLLLGQFDVDPDKCREETTTFLEKLHERGLVVAHQAD